jgi:hypothetical protein
MTTEVIDGYDTHTGSSFNSFLEEEGIRAEVDSAAASAVLAWQAEHPELTQPSARDETK